MGLRHTLNIGKVGLSVFSPGLMDTHNKLFGIVAGFPGMFSATMHMIVCSVALSIKGCGVGGTEEAKRASRLHPLSGDLGPQDRSEETQHQ